MSEKLSPLSNDMIEKMEKIGEKIKENKINLSQTAKTVIEKRYLIKDKDGKPTETAENMFWRVAVNIASADLIYEPFIDITEKAKKFYSLMSNFEFLPNSPTLMNAGRDLQQLSACFVLPVGDSMESIFDTIKNTALIHKTGGGTGFSFSNLRPKNDRVATTGGVASGPLSFMRVFNSATDVIKQGGTRRGANMAILNVDHPDILEFITAKKDTNELTNFNLSVGVNEDFMERVMNDQEYNLINPNNKEIVSTLRAREVFDLIVEMAWQNGEPGVVFIDRLNKGNPTPHIGNIESTNPCITGDCLVSTQYGLMRMDRIVELYAQGGLGVVTDNRVEQYFSAKMEATYNMPVVEFEDGTSVNFISRAIESGVKEVYKIETCAGYELEATADHKIMTTDGWVKTGDLKPDVHKVLLQSGEGRFKDAEIKFLKDIFVEKGTILTDEKNKAHCIKLVSKSKKILKKVQVYLLNLGIFSKISKNNCQKTHFELNISHENVNVFLNKIRSVELKYKNTVECHSEALAEESNNKKELRREILRCAQDDNKIRFEDKIWKIKKVGKRKVYDLTEPTTHSFIANGMVISNCGEQPLLPYEACNLGSINLYKMIKEENGKTVVDYDKLEKTVRTAVQFLDNVIDVNRYPLKQIDEMVKGNRKIGLGVMGFADMLTMLDITYNSNAALKTAEEVMKFIQDIAYEESAAIAERRGVFPNYEGSLWHKKGMRLRNATVTTIAPTGTLSILSNCSSGIEPIFGMCFVRQILGGERFIEVNPVFEKMAKENSFYTPELMEEIAEKGTLKHIKGIPAEVRKLFVTSYDVAPMWHIKMQAAFQKYTDNAVSKTVNFPENATREDIKEVYYLAYQEGCKGVTVYRNSSRSEQVISVGNGQASSVKAKPSSTPPPRTIEEEDDAAFFTFDHLQTHRNLISPRSRPEVTFGITEKIPICKGNLYITINYDEYGICEVLLQNKDFIGHFCNYNLEMLGKFISLAISSGIQIKHILEQLKGKKCANCINNAETAVLSCSDGVSKVLERAWMKIPHFVFLSRQKSGMDTGTLEETVKQLSKDSHRMGKDTLIIENNASRHDNADEEDLCPECKGQIEYVEGCMVCRNCGFSKCG